MLKATRAVEWVALDRVFCNPANPRINDVAVEPLSGSLRRFGWQQPIVAKKSGEVIAGNTRLKAAHKLGMSEVSVVWFGEHRLMCGDSTSTVDVARLLQGEQGALL